MTFDHIRSRCIAVRGRGLGRVLGGAGGKKLSFRFRLSRRLGNPALQALEPGNGGLAPAVVLRLTQFREARGRGGTRQSANSRSPVF